MTSYVITHDEWGIYLGSCMGLGFWSRLDPAGQIEAVVFEDPATARTYIRGWDENNDPTDYRFVEVKATYAKYATLADLKAAGLGHLVGEMEKSGLEFIDVVGSA